jgi:hypothetical protein
MPELIDVPDLEPVANPGAAGIVAVPMAAALEAAWTSEGRLDSIPAAAASIASSSSPSSSSYATPPDTPTYSPSASAQPGSPSYWPPPTPAPVIPVGLDTPAETPEPLDFEPLDFEYDEEAHMNYLRMSGQSEFVPNHLPKEGMEN